MATTRRQQAAQAATEKKTAAPPASVAPAVEQSGLEEFAAGATAMTVDQLNAAAAPSEEDLEDIVTWTPPAAEEGPSFADLVADARNGTAPIVSAQMLTGERYIRLDREQKTQLEGVEFLIEEFEIKEGQNEDGGDYAYSILRVLTRDGERFSFTDSGAGITPVLDQLDALIVAGKAPRNIKVHCKLGLRGSRYEYRGQPVVTWYLT